MRGIYPSNDSMAEVGYPRIKQAFLNMQWLAEYAGAELTDCSRLVVYTTDMFRWVGCLVCLSGPFCQPYDPTLPLRERGGPFVAD